MKKAVFWDRDGVINKAILRNNKVFSPRELKDFEIVPGVRKILAECRQQGYLNIVITNQPDISRGLMSRDILDSMHRIIQEQLCVDDIFVCPHDDQDQCTCRKPKPGMMIDAAQKWGIDLRASFVVGDQWKDVDAGKNSGCSTILLSSCYNQGVAADFIIDEISSAADIIAGHGKGRLT
ncbi:MAG: HAD family hydrolase [Candidatus Omnitrophica bacterium]|nr:HAD family hydrolase [Candidatus Omnitrophota bacterium]